MTLYADRTIPLGARLKPPAELRADGAGPAPVLPAQVDVAVIGAGVIGLSIAWRLVCRGLSVAVFDRAEPGSGTSFAATGMLAAAAEEYTRSAADFGTFVHSLCELWGTSGSRPPRATMDTRLPSAPKTCANSAAM